MNQTQMKKLVSTALCIALGLAMPSVFHLFGALSGQVFLPMHIPALLCGFVAGPLYGLACGAILPLLSSVLTGMPPIFPTGVSMVCELAAYGFFCGLFYQEKGRKIYPSLLPAMLVGRAVSGVAGALFMGMAGNPYTLAIFLTGAFVKPIPGIIIQLFVVPLLVKALEKSGILEARKPAAA